MSMIAKSSFETNLRKLARYAECSRGATAIVRGLLQLLRPLSLLKACILFTLDDFVKILFCHGSCAALFIGELCAVNVSLPW